MPSIKVPENNIRRPSDLNIIKEEVKQEEHLTTKQVDEDDEDFDGEHFVTARDYFTD